MDAKSEPHSYSLDDLPAEVDALDFAPYVETLADLISSPDSKTPLTIGVFGTWGSGKTSLMKQLRKALPHHYRTAWFDAWKYDKEETLWRALLLQVLTALQESLPENAAAVDRQELEDLQTALYREVEREEVGGLTVDLGKLATGTVQASLQIGLSLLPGVSAVAELAKALQGEGAKATGDIFQAFQRQRTQVHVEHVLYLEQFQKRFNKLVDDYIVKEKHRLVVFIDDLDRCLPEKAVEVLEAIKLFLDAPGCVFILGLDQEVIARGVEIKYHEYLAKKREGEASEAVEASHLIEGARYLEKIIQLPFQIPPIEAGDIEGFVTGLVPEWPDADCPRVFAAGLGENPRQVKRTVNIFLLLWGLVWRRKEKLGEGIKPLRLAKVVVIQQVYPELYQVLREYPHLLGALEKYYRAEAQAGGPREAGAGAPGEGKAGEADLPAVTGRGTELARPEIARPEPPPLLASFVSRQAIRRILTLHPLEAPEANFAELSEDELKPYFTLTRRAEAPLPAPTEAPRPAFEPQLVRIPAGRFRMGSTPEETRQAVEQGMDEKWVKEEQPQHAVELSEYWIGKYPVTNAEYQAFVKEANHPPPQDWDGQSYPQGKGLHPVVYVSWDDAAAYCEWLSKQSTNRRYRLPSEAEWEKAASWEPSGGEGTGKKRIYPWGDEAPDETRCNFGMNVGDTTPVGRYSPQGDSPYGCADMAGNVWEWCADWYDEKAYKERQGEGIKDPQGPETGTWRVLRGGSFDYDPRRVRCACRYRYYPDYRNYYFGFRVAASPI